MIAAWGVQTSWNRPPKGPVATHQGAWHQRIDDNPLTAQIPGLSHRKIRLGPTFHTAWSGYATLPRPTCFQRLRRFETVLQYRFDWRYLCAMMIGSSSPGETSSRLISIGSHRSSPLVLPRFAVLLPSTAVHGQPRVPRSRGRSRGARCPGSAPRFPPGHGCG